MVAAKPTGASALTMTPAPVASVSNNDNATEPVNKNDAFDEIKNKFLNEIDKIPRECQTQNPNLFRSTNSYWCDSTQRF